MAIEWPPPTPDNTTEFIRYLIQMDDVQDIYNGSGYFDQLPPIEQENAYNQLKEHFGERFQRDKVGRVATPHSPKGTLARVKRNAARRSRTLPTDNDPQTTLEQERAETPRDLSLKDATRKDAGEAWPPDGWRIHQNAPTINLSHHDQGPETVAEALAAIRQTNDPPRIMQRDGQLVTVVSDERGVSSIRLLDISALSDALAYSAHWRRSAVGEDGVVSTRTTLPPHYIARMIDHHAGWPAYIILPLRGLSPTPLLRSDGSLHATVGYDPVTRYWYVPNPSGGAGFADRMEPLAHEAPTRADAVAAVAILREWLFDFPFESEAERANALALFLTLLARSLLRESGDNIPLALIEASKPRTGKTLLSETLILVSLGVMPALTSIPPDEEEMRKSLLTLALSGRPYWVLDNLNEKLDSAALASSLTTGRIQGRMLGGHHEVDAEIAAVMVATANQPVATTELLARSYRIRLNANMARPQDRDPSSYKHPRILRYTLEHRAEIVAAGLTILRAYLLVGSPRYDLPAKGGYEGWVELIGGALAYVGVTAFLTNEKALAESADDEAGEIERFYAALWSQYGKKEWRVSDLQKDAKVEGSGLSMTLPARLAETLAFPSQFATTAGKYLRRLEGVPYGAPEMRLHGRADSHLNQTVWSLESGEADKATPQVSTNGHAPIARSDAQRLLEEGQTVQ
jgi:hypothetical protein